MFAGRPERVHGPAEVFQQGRFPGEPEPVEEWPQHRLRIAREGLVGHHVMPRGIRGAERQLLMDVIG